MAAGAVPLSGEFTPEADLSSYQIDPGRSTTFIIVQEKSGTLQSGKRNFGYCIAYEEGGALWTYASASNAGGTSWGSVWHWSNVNKSTNPIEKNGNSYTITPGKFTSGMKLLAGVTYEWFAM